MRMCWRNSFQEACRKTCQQFLGFMGGWIRSLLLGNIYLWHRSQHPLLWLWSTGGGLLSRLLLLYFFRPTFPLLMFTLRACFRGWNYPFRSSFSTLQTLIFSRIEAFCKDSRLSSTKSFQTTHNNRPMPRRYRTLFLSSRTQFQSLRVGHLTLGCLPHRHKSVPLPRWAYSLPRRLRESRGLALYLIAQDFRNIWQSKLSHHCRRNCITAISSLISPSRRAISNFLLPHRDSRHLMFQCYQCFVGS